MGGTATPRDTAWPRNRRTGCSGVPEGRGRRGLECKVCDREAVEGMGSRLEGIVCWASLDLRALAVAWSLEGRVEGLSGPNHSFDASIKAVLSGGDAVREEWKVVLSSGALSSQIAGMCADLTLWEAGGCGERRTAQREGETPAQPGQLPSKPAGPSGALGEALRPFHPSNATHAPPSGSLSLSPG